MRRTFIYITLAVLIGIPFALYANEQEASPTATVKKYYRTRSGLFFESKWGKWQRSESGLYNPTNLKVHPGGEIYITSSGDSGDAEDFAYHRAQRFSEKGQFIAWFGGYMGGIQQPGWIERPRSVSFAPNGDVHLLETLGGHTKTYTPEGELKADFSSFGGSGGPTIFPNTVCGDKDGAIYVSLYSALDGYINKFDKNGKLLNAITKDTMGKGNEFKSGPNGLACDRFGNLYACDRGKNRVVKFDPDGNILDEFKSAPIGAPVLVHVDSDFTAEGMEYPDEVAVSPNGTLYVLADSKVYRYDSAGQLISVFGGKGEGDNLFRSAQSLACGPDGRVYVLDADYTAKIASVKIYRPAYYTHKYAKVKLVGKVSGMSASNFALVTVVVEGTDAAGNEFFAAARPAANGKFIFKKFPKDASYRLSLRGTNTFVYNEPPDLTGKANGNVMGLNFKAVAK
jgi:sugar lactone lactonase YvrE